MEERKSIQKLDGELVVFFNATPAQVESWRHAEDWIPEDLPAVADPAAVLYESLGTIRRRSPLGLVPGSIGPVLRAAAGGQLPKLTSADMLRLGADVAVRSDGKIATLHRARTPDDRVAMADLVAALDS